MNEALAILAFHQVYDPVGGNIALSALIAGIPLYILFILLAVLRLPAWISALTAMLYEHGVSVEMLRFHQLQSDDTTATFIQGTDGLHTQWAMGWSEDKDVSAIQAIVACANRLMSVAWYVDIDAVAKRYVWKRR